MLRITVISILLFFFGSASAQFTTTGSATAAGGCDCFDLTQDVANQTGTFYNNSTISLNNPFDLMFNVNFGCNDFGAEGMGFKLQSGAWTQGSGGSGMGFGGVANSLTVEFDTYDNNLALNNWDVPADHIALQANGNTFHNNASCLVGNPNNIQISNSSANVEDCLDHLVRIVWTPGASQTMDVYVDGNLRFSHTLDFITNVFGGNPTVTWGWTGSTGTTFTNQQTVCMALVPDFTYSATNCPGQVINFTDASVSYYGIASYSWDFDGQGSSSLPNPSFTFNDAGNHPVSLTITDNNGCMETVVIEVGVGFETDVTSDASIICPNTSTDLHATAVPFVGNNCCFDVVLVDLWDDGWAGNEVEIFVDGVSQGTYEPTSPGFGGPYEEAFNFCWDLGAVVEIVIDGDQYPGECAYYVIDQLGDTVMHVDPGVANWIDGYSQQFTVNCGVTPPAYTFQWDNAGLLSDDTDPDPTATVATATWFHVDITDPGTGCVITDSVFIDTYATGSADLNGSLTVCQGSCDNATMTFTGPTPYTFELTGPSGPMGPQTTSTSPFNVSLCEDGTYNITSFTAAGCNNIANTSGSADVTVIIPPSVDIEADAEYCEGDAMSDLTVVSSNGGTVNWYADAGLTVNIGSGNSYTPSTSPGSVTYYAAETESVLGCEGPSDQVTITVHEYPDAPTWTGQTVYCEGDLPSLLTAEPMMGGDITWYDADPTGGSANVLSILVSYNPILNVPGVDIWLTETANGCEGPPTYLYVTVNPTPDAPVVNGQTEYCEGDSPTPLTATPSIGGSIEWENSIGTSLGTGVNYTPSLNVGDTDYYTFETLNGCTGPATITTITVEPAPTVSVTKEVEICYGDSIKITALNNGFDISWSDGQLGETVYLGPDTTTKYIVTATNPLCGTADDSINVIVNYLPPVEAGNDTLIGIGGEVTLWAYSDSNVIFSWIPDINECITPACDEVYDVPDQATVYVVIATDQNGCQNSDSVLVDINGYMEVFVPNIFSPNNDGYNDFLEVKGPRLFNYHIEIYDRWGKRVFVSNEQKDYWDGTLDGKELAPQTFVYILSGETVLGEKIVQEGNVSIIK